MVGLKQDLISGRRRHFVNVGLNIHLLGNDGVYKKIFGRESLCVPGLT